MSAPVIAVDTMSGDFGPRCIVQACAESLAEFPLLRLILVGPHDLLADLLVEHPHLDRQRLHIHAASETVTMSDRPSRVLRGLPDSSMRQALERVRCGEAQACLSAGNTGALMALSCHILKTLPGIDRPAMVSAIPTLQGHALLLDLGANVDCSAQALCQFAVMGSVLAEVQGMHRPRVALLNVGLEAIKGNQQVREAAERLADAADLNYVGFIEGDGLYRGEADVVVCDGFVGNVVLKASEGLAAMIATRVAAQFSSGLRARLVGLLALPFLRRLQSDLRPARYNGASLLGLQGIVVKSHGSAGVEGLRSAIRRTLQEISENLPQRLGERLGQRLS